MLECTDNWRSEIQGKFLLSLLIFYKLGDLSESTMLSNLNYAKTKRIGTPLYLAPEIIKHESYDHRCDIWSFGVVMYHMATLEFPF